MDLFAAIRAAAGEPAKAKNLTAEQAHAAWTPDVGFASTEESEWTHRVEAIVSEPSGADLAPMAEIIPGSLYLSGMAAATSAERLAEYDITHVLNCTGEPLDYPLNLQVHTVEGAMDTNGYPMLGLHFDHSKQFIQEGIASGGRVLVHCRHGKNRSAVIVTAYIIAVERVPLLAAVERVFAARPIVLSNQSFRRDLVRLAKEEQLLTKTAIEPEPDHVQ